MATFKLKPLVVVPAAGFGTRVGSPPAKELMPDRHGEPLIAHVLNQALERKWDVLVITREVKTSLVEYLEQYQSNTGLGISLQYITQSQEWPDTVLQSRSYWRDKNLLCLPDTRYQPLKIWDEIVNSPLDCSFATFDVTDLRTWGAVKVSNKYFDICEKPQNPEPEARAWGLIGFTKKAGEYLFSAQMQSIERGDWQRVPLQANIFPLESFEDLTR